MPGFLLLPLAGEKHLKHLNLSYVTPCNQQLELTIFFYYFHSTWERGKDREKKVIFEPQQRVRVTQNRYQLRTESKCFETASIPLSDICVRTACSERMCMKPPLSFFILKIQIFNTQSSSTVSKIRKKKRGKNRKPYAQSNFAENPQTTEKQLLTTYI